MLEEALARLSALMADCRDPWHIFGGTALYLHGYRLSPLADIDVLASPGDAERIAALNGFENEADGGTQRFRSPIVLHPRLGGMPVEIMAGFEIFAEGRWQTIKVWQAEEIRFGSATVRVASLPDIGDILRLCGRPKDLERLESLGSAARRQA